MSNLYKIPETDFNAKVCFSRCIRFAFAKKLVFPVWFEIFIG